MRRVSILFLQRSHIHCVSFTVLIPVYLLVLLIFPSVTFCTTWEPIGPEGGNFIFSMSNPADANEITAITTHPSPSNVYRSTDAGASWSKIGEIPYSYVSDVSAFDFSTLYAITGSRCYRSTDGGVRWTSALMPSSVGRAYRVCADPTNIRNVYAVGYEYDYTNRIDKMAFFISTDGGLSWSGSQFFSFESFTLYDMAISKSNPYAMYVSGYKQTSSGSYGALFKTSDGGNTWTDISNAVDNERNHRFISVAVDPTDDEKVYVGGSYFYRSSRIGHDRELTWTRSQSPHYIDRYIYPIYTIDIDPTDPSRIYTGSYKSLAFSTNYGLSWSVRNNRIKSSAQHIEVAPADPSKVYVSGYMDLYKSSDSGSNWETAHGGIFATRINALAVDPSVIITQNSGYLMAYGMSHGRGRTNTWEDVVTPESCGTVCDILIDPDNPDTVLVLEGAG